MMNKIVSEIVDVILSLPEGTELATSDVIKQLYGHEYLTCGDYEIHGEMFGFEDFFEIDARVHKLAKKRGLILDDSKYDGMATGLPFTFRLLCGENASKPFNFGILFNFTFSGSVGMTSGTVRYMQKHRQ